jgi:hypothetical protein
MFVATIRTSYRVMSAGPVMRFVCVSDLDEYRESLRDPSCTVVHYFQPLGSLDGGVRGGVPARRARCRRSTAVGPPRHTRWDADRHRWRRS